MRSEPVRKNNKLKRTKRRSSHNLYYHCSFVLKKVAHRNSNLTTYALYQDLYKIGQKTGQTGLRYKYNLLDAIDLLIKANLVVKEKKGIQRELIVPTKLGRDIGTMLVSIDRFKSSYQDLIQNNESRDKIASPYDWALDALKENALSHFIKIIFIKFHLVTTENILNEGAKSILKEIMLSASDFHSRMLSEYLKQLSEQLKESPGFKDLDPRIDPAIHKVIYDLFGPLNKGGLIDMGIKTLHAVLSIIGLPNAELIHKILEDKRTFLTAIEMGYVEVTRDYSHKDPKVQLSLYEKLLNNINTFQS